MIKKLVQKYTKQYLDAIFKSESITDRAGFYSPSELRGFTASWLFLPFGAQKILCKVRTLSAGEFPDVGFIELGKEYAEARTYETKAKLIDLQALYCRRALVSPTYDELEHYILDEVPSVRVGRDALELAKKEMETLDYEDRRKYLSKVQELALFYGCLLPPNFLGAITAWCECLDITNIKKLGKDDLIKAHALSLLNKNRASDNLQGIFLERSRTEIDILASTLYKEAKK